MILSDVTDAIGYSVSPSTIAMSDAMTAKYRWSGLGLLRFRMLLAVVSVKCNRHTDVRSSVSFRLTACEHGGV